MKKPATKSDTFGSNLIIAHNTRTAMDKNYYAMAISVLSKVGYEECIDYVFRLYDLIEKVAKEMNIKVSDLTTAQLKAIDSACKKGETDPVKIVAQIKHKLKP